MTKQKNTLKNLNKKLAVMETKMDQEQEINMADLLGSGTPAKPTTQAKPTIQELYGSLGSEYAKLGIATDDLGLLDLKLNDFAHDCLRFWSVTLFGAENYQRFQFNDFYPRDGQITFWDRHDENYHENYHETIPHVYTLTQMLRDISVELEHRGMRRNLASELDIANTVTPARG
jgi:hypothetical protein